MATWQNDYNEGQTERWSLELDTELRITLSATRTGRLEPWTVAAETNKGEIFLQEKVRMPDGSPAILSFERLYAQQATVTMFDRWAEECTDSIKQTWPAETRLAEAIADHLYRAHMITDAVWLCQDAIADKLANHLDVRPITIAQFLFDCGYIKSDPLIAPAAEIIGHYIDDNGESKI